MKKFLIPVLMALSSTAFAAPVVSTNCVGSDGDSLSINDTGPIMIPAFPKAHAVVDGQAYTATDDPTNKVNAQVIYSFGPKKSIPTPNPASTTKFKARLVLKSASGKPIFDEFDAADQKETKSAVTTFPVVCTEIHGFAAL
jgi:hypothetical protein